MDWIPRGSLGSLRFGLFWQYHCTMLPSGPYHGGRCHQRLAGAGSSVQRDRKASRSVLGSAVPERLRSVTVQQTVEDRLYAAFRLFRGDPLYLEVFVVQVDCLLEATSIQSPLGGSRRDLLDRFHTLQVDVIELIRV